jgi:hypothetical protein
MVSVRQLSALLALAVTSTLLAGTLADCAGEAPCQTDSDCFQAYCSNGSCVQDCTSSADCPQGYVCNEVAQCQAPVPDGAAPGVDGHVEAHAAPDSNHIGVDATMTDATPSQEADSPDSSFPDGSVHHDSGGSDGGFDATPPPDAGHHDAVSSMDAGKDVVTTHMDAHADASGPPLTEFDLCSTDGQCAENLVCRALYVGGATRCTRTCTTTAQCMASTRCVTTGAEEYCVLADTGLTCTEAASCNFACLINQQYCTMACTTGSDCPNGYGCAAVGTPSVSVCVKAEVPCDATDTSGCIAPAACDTSLSLVVSGCTLACDSASDCPQRAAGLTPWTCDGLCRRPPDVVGPLQQGATPAQYACDAEFGDEVVNVCNDAQHIDFTAFDVPSPPAVNCESPTTTAGIATDSCVDSCLYQGGCAFGYACTAVGSVGANSRIGLCLPALGEGEIGTSCTEAADCFFGFCNLTTGKCSRDCTADGLCTTGSTCTASGTIPVEGLPFRECE